MPVMGRLDDLFSASVCKHASRPALCANDRYWSYGELNAKCRSIEHALMSRRTPVRQRVVGLVHAKSAFSYAAVVAIMRTGNIYVPLNARTPGVNLAHLIDVAGIDALIVDFAGVAPEILHRSVAQTRPIDLIFDGSDPDASVQASRLSVLGHECSLALPTDFFSTSIPARTTAPSRTDVAYIIYTSGSTGAPKGVAISQASACQLIEKLHRVVATDENDRFSQFSAFTFDVSVAEMFLCWKGGGTLFAPALHDSLVPTSFALRHEITVWSSSPSLAQGMLKLNQLTSNALPQIKWSLFCGEVLPCELAHAWSIAAPRSRTFNIYGPTEMAMFSTYHEFDCHAAAKHGVVPIGHPFEGMETMVVTNGHRVLDNETPGELWLSGEQLGLGYWKAPQITQAAFVSMLGDETLSRTWYRTGDLVSRSANGELLFRGRIDRQVKVLGHRVELDAVESALREILGCSRIAVVPVHADNGICEHLVAYCDRLETSERTQKDRCRQHLPPHMIPSRFLALAEFPSTSSGKIDYRALAAYARSIEHVRSNSGLRIDGRDESG